MQVPRNAPNRLPSWEELTIHTRRTAAKDDKTFLTELDELRARKPSFGWRFGRSVITSVLRDPVYQKFLECGWTDIIDMLADQVVRNKELLKHEARATPESQQIGDRASHSLFRPYNQMPCTRETAVARVAQAQRLIGLDEPILLLGDDDLVSVELAMAGFTNVTAVDIDQKVLDEIAKVAQEAGLNIKLKQHDLSNPVPAGLYGKYKLVFFDPFYSVKGVTLFLEGALEMTRNAPGTLFFISVHVMSMMPSGLPQLTALFEQKGLEIREFHQGFNAYPAPKRLKSLIHLVNRIVLGSKTLTTEGYSFPFFLSDAILLSKL